MDFSKILYNALPRIYRKEDAKVNSVNPFPLQRFIQILGSGFEDVKNNIDDMSSIYDIEKCPSVFLPYLAKTLGIEFPYNMDEITQRKFLKVLPYLYKMKGSSEVFLYLAREILGNDISLSITKTDYEEGMTSSEWLRIYLIVKINNELSYSATKQANFVKFAELFRPVNSILIVNYNFFYRDDFDFDSIQDSYYFDHLLFPTISETFENNIEILNTNTLVTYVRPKSTLTNGAKLNSEFHLCDPLLNESYNY